MVLLEPVDMGGEASWPRLLGLAAAKGPSLSPDWYLEIPDHSLPPTETGDKGPFRPFIVETEEVCFGSGVPVRSALLLVCFDPRFIACDQTLNTSARCQMKTVTVRLCPYRELPQHATTCRA
jgi:hypothetical protein